MSTEDITRFIDAAKDGNTSEVSSLLSTFGQRIVNVKNENGWTALMFASYYGHKDVASLLVEAGADVNDKENYGHTALLLASGNGHKEVVSLLVGRADIQAKNSFGQAALLLASANGHKEVVSLLMEAGANVYAKNNDGKTAADLAKTPEIRDMIQASSDKMNPQLLEAASRVEEQEDSTVKLVLVGAGRAGKTGLANSLLGNSYRETESTVGITEFSCVVSEATAGDENSGGWTLTDSNTRQPGQLEEKLALAILRNKPKPTPTPPTKPKNLPKEVGKVEAGELPPTAAAPRQHRRILEQPVGEENSDIVERDEGKETARSFDVKAVVDEESFYKALGEGCLGGMKYKIRLYDFGGQEVFYSVHHFFLTKQSVYLILFNMEWLVPGPREQKSKRLSDLKFWLNSVVMHTSDISVDGGFSVAPFAFVGTHKDSVRDPADHESISKMLENEFSNNIAWGSRMQYHGAQGSRGRVTLNFFPVDNTISGRDPVVASLTRTVEKELDDTPAFHLKKPVSWFYLYDQLVALETNMISFRAVLSVAERCGLSASSLPQVLRHYHNLGFLMWHEEDSLREYVVMDPVSFFVKPATMIICNYTVTYRDHEIHSRPVHKKYSRIYPAQWRDLLQQGVMDTRLLVGLLEDSESSVDVVVSLMVSYGLLVPLRSDSEGGNTEYRQYLVPALLPQGSKLGGGKLDLDHKFLVHFTLKDTRDYHNIGFQRDLEANGFLPQGLFERFIGRVFQWIQKTTTQELDYEAKKEFVLVYIGSQMVHLSVAKDLNCIRVDVQGGSPLRVQDRISKVINGVVAESMRGLRALYLLAYDGSHSTTSSGKPVSRGLVNGDTLFLKLEAVKEVLEGGQASVSRAKGRPVQMSRLQIQEKFSAWSTTPPVLDHVDVFISYRWGKRDEDFTEMLYDRLSTEVLATENHRPLVMFLDKKRLKDGDQFREEFVKALVSTRVFAPIVSADAIKKMTTHDSTRIDNVLLEWICACVCLEAGRIRVVLPVAFGDSQDIEVKDLSQHPILGQLPKTTPTATVNKAHELLNKFGVTCSLDRLMQFTVHSVVNEYMFDRYLAICAWYFREDNFVDECARRVLKAVEGLTWDVRPAESTQPAAPSQGTGNSSSQDIPLISLIDRLKRELDIESGNVLQVLIAAERVLVNKDDEEYSKLKGAKSKAVYLVDNCL